jgi:hypothetical protein
MKRIALALVLAAQLSLAAAAAADPGLDVRYVAGVPRLQLEGDFARARYTVLRAAAAEGAMIPISSLEALCTGSCFADDPSALPGATYWYRFDLILEGGQPVRFGPYRVTISPELARRASARMSPNPGRGVTQVELALAGERGGPALAAEAILFDLQGRKVATVFRGPLAPGLTRLGWSGRDDQGAEVRAGSYFLRLIAGPYSHVTRVARVR